MIWYVKIHFLLKYMYMEFLIHIQVLHKMFIGSDFSQLFTYPNVINGTAIRLISLI